VLSLPSNPLLILHIVHMCVCMCVCVCVCMYVCMESVYSLPSNPLLILHIVCMRAQEVCNPLFVIGCEVFVDLYIS